MSKAPNFNNDIKKNALSEAEVEKLVPGFIASTKEGSFSSYEKFTSPAEEKCKRGSVIIVKYKDIFIRATVTSKKINPHTDEFDVRVSTGSWSFRVSGCYDYALVNP